MNAGATFDRVYSALKERLATGSLSPGDHLEPAAIGRELNSSITPVRDALHRLVGEHIVEAPRNDGFRVPVLMELELRDLYAWNLDILELALRKGPANRAATTAMAATTGSPSMIAGGSIADLFLVISRHSGNREFEREVASTNDRLAPVRVVEERVFPDHAEEREVLRLLFERGDLPSLRRSLGAYHRQRQRSVPDLMALMRAPR